MQPSEFMKIALLLYLAKITDDFKTGKKFPGGKQYVAFFRDEDYPVFAKKRN